MGYSTDFTLVIDHSLNAEQIKQELEKISGYHFSQESLSTLFLREAKWYDHTKDMIELSKMYPEQLFRLEGMGEENADMWIEYHKNGKYQVILATITFAPFDESKLR